jgi:HAD superfamily hydrolase (TIGR01509 family)
MSVELVIFDLDGVLVDACEWHRVALNEALKEVCNYEISLEDHYNKYNGLPTKVKLAALTEINILSEDEHIDVYDLKQEKTKEIIESNAKIRQEKIDLLEWLVQDKNLKVACFTNSIRETAYMMLDKTGILNYFDMVLTNQDVEKPKPDPEGYIKTLKELDISNKNTIIVEDSPKGLQAAKESGCHVISVKNADEVTIELFKEVLK